MGKLEDEVNTKEVLDALKKVVNQIKLSEYDVKTLRKLIRNVEMTKEEQEQYELWKKVSYAMYPITEEGLMRLVSRYLLTPKT